MLSCDTATSLIGRVVIDIFTPAFLRGYPWLTRFAPHYKDDKCHLNCEMYLPRAPAKDRFTSHSVWMLDTIAAWV